MTWQTSHFSAALLGAALAHAAARRPDNAVFDTVIVAASACLAPLAGVVGIETVRQR